MDESIARANLKHFKTLLETEADPSKRTILLKLLAEEEEKLSAALERKRKKS